LLGESGANLLVMIGITPNDVGGLQILGLPEKVIKSKLRALKATGLVHQKEEKFFLTQQGKSIAKTLMELYKL
jgi:predicted transcriptional regulator